MPRIDEPRPIRGNVPPVDIQLMDRENEHVRETASPRANKRGR